MEMYQLIPFLPLAGFFINILFGRRFIRDKAHWVAVPVVAASWVISLYTVGDVLGGKVYNEDLYSWVKTTGFMSAVEFKASVGFLVDQLTAVMLVVVTTVSTLVHIYSIGYMHGDKGYYRFFAYLNLFTFSMLMLVMANNFLQLYFGWEAVGLCSYFLIGYWYEKKSAADAGKKAFIVNRFGDFGFGLGVIIIFLTLGTVHYADVFGAVGGITHMSVNVLGYDVNLVTLIALLLFCGAVGKSAQIPLHVWLPDAMEGPTPVSALIHAATMVTAGVFMVARCSPIFTLSPFAMSVVAVVGAVTALFAATIALVQNDIKRIVAYSTVSQLGYMFLACGVGAFGAGIFHLYTHAFFKALLFLGAGSVMHAMGGELDIQKMGGLRKHLPVTFWTFMLATISISGFPLFAGFFSKDEILWMAFASENPVGKFAWFLGAVTALMTAFYSFRLVYLTFYGEFRSDAEEMKRHAAHHGHDPHHLLHEPSWSMKIPLILLGLGAVGAGYVGLPALWVGEHGNLFAEFTKPVLGHPEIHASHTMEWLLMGFSVLIAVCGWLLARHFYIKRPDLPVKAGRKLSMPYWLLWNKYFVDEIYNAFIVRPVFWVARSIIVAVTDGKIIEGIVNGLPRSIGRTSELIRKIQTGLVHHYAAVMGLGLLAVIAIAFMW